MVQIPLRPKMIYMAPMKSLCSEKYREWRDKFETSLRGAVRILGWVHLKYVTMASFKIKFRGMY